jgi:hypothetical protein
MVISVSRRCDIPRFAFDWFLARLDTGFVELVNPYNCKQIRKVSLLPPAYGRPMEECAELFAFWTRDPAAILEHSRNLEDRGHTFFVMNTLNSYPLVLEPNPPPAAKVIENMKILATVIGSDRLIWRYDPVFLSDLTDFEFHRRNFKELAGRFSGAVSRVIVSVYDEYAKTERRLTTLEQRGELRRLPHYEPGGKTILPELRELLSELASIARKEGMEIQSCAEEGLLDCGIKSGACIDGDYLEKVFGIKKSGKDRGQTRPGCLCAKSVDIGSYSNCPAGCVYCYGIK